MRGGLTSKHNRFRAEDQALCRGLPCVPSDPVFVIRKPLIKLVPGMQTLCLFFVECEGEADVLHMACAGLLEGLVHRQEEFPFRPLTDLVGHAA